MTSHLHSVFLSPALPGVHRVTLPWRMQVGGQRSPSPPPPPGQASTSLPEPLKIGPHLCTARPARSRLGQSRKRTESARTNGSISADP